MAQSVSVKALSPSPAVVPLSRAFLGSTYGQPWQRFGLSSECQEGAPAWAEAVRSWGIVTAWNPWGQMQDEATNQLAHERLRRRVRRAGYTPLLGHNGEGMWRETALIVPGATLHDMVRWGREFQQAAVVLGVGRRAALVWLIHDRVQVERHWLSPVEAGEFS